MKFFPVLLRYGVMKVSDEEAKRLLVAVRDAQDVASSAVENRRQAVRSAFEAGISGTLIAQEMGVSRARAYQIRDGK